MDDVAMRRSIERKRSGEELAGAEWEAIVAAYSSGAIDEAQMAAMAMACVWRGLSTQEAAAMTRAMVASGETLQYPPGTIVVDKHSSGGVSDLVSLVVVPVVAACGVRVAKLSGRALGHTGGTIDKLETIPGLEVALSMERFVEQVQGIGCAIAAQTDAFVPADKLLYALRDRTATVPSLGLIASSIVSKKIAGGAGAFVFDVKCGDAAFMREPWAAIELAETLVNISRTFDRSARAFVTDMNEPLGRSIGTAIEVIEARDFLRGSEMIPRVRSLCLHIAEAMLELAGRDRANDAAGWALDSGAAYEKFVEMVEAQGGSRDSYEAMTRSPHCREALAERDGFVQAVDAVALGNLAREWSAHDPSGGVRVLVRTGDSVSKNQPLAEAYGAHSNASKMQPAFAIGLTAPPARPLIYATM